MHVRWAKIGLYDEATADAVRIQYGGVTPHSGIVDGMPTGPGCLWAALAAESSAGFSTARDGVGLLFARALANPGWRGSARGEKHGGCVRGA